MSLKENSTFELVYVGRASDWQEKQFLVIKNIIIIDGYNHFKTIPRTAKLINT